LVRRAPHDDKSATLVDRAARLHDVRSTVFAAHRPGVRPPSPLAASRSTPLRSDRARSPRSPSEAPRPTRRRPPPPPATPSARPYSSSPPTQAYREEASSQRIAKPNNEKFTSVDATA